MWPTPISNTYRPYHILCIAIGFLYYHTSLGNFPHLLVERRSQDMSQNLMYNNNAHMMHYPTVSCQYLTFTIVQFTTVIPLKRALWNLPVCKPKAFYRSVVDLQNRQFKILEKLEKSTWVYFFASLPSLVITSPERIIPGAPRHGINYVYIDALVQLDSGFVYTQWAMSSWSYGTYR